MKDEKLNDIQYIRLDNYFRQALQLKIKDVVANVTRKNQ